LPNSQAVGHAIYLVLASRCQDDQAARPRRWPCFPQILLATPLSYSQRAGIFSKFGLGDPTRRGDAVRCSLGGVGTRICFPRKGCDGGGGCCWGVSPAGPWLAHKAESLV